MEEDYSDLGLIDTHKRIHDYLRLSVTDQCNFRCLYCMPNEQMKFMPNDHLMSLEEILKLASIFIEHGVRKIRLTGGEPLVRKDIKKIILGLAKYPVELTLTTNGVFIGENLDAIVEAGIKSINISIDSLNPEKFKSITQRDAFAKVWENIQRLLALKMHVKLNVVLMKGYNDDEINQFVALTKDQPIHVRFIEFMPFSGNKWEDNKVVPLSFILSEVDKQYSFLKLTDRKHDTARKYKVYGHEGTFAIISTMTQPFCHDCNRIRVTADGKIKNCLFSPEETDLIGTMRKGGDIRPIIFKSIMDKHERQGGQLEENYRLNNPDAIQNRSMINIGG